MQRKLKYSINMDLKGTTVLTASLGDFESLGQLKKLLKKYIEENLGCEVIIKECGIEWVE